MSLPHRLTRLARRTLDVLLVALIVLVLATVAMARGVPWITGGSTFIVGGGSMEPAIPFGAVVFTTPVRDEALAVGDVVSVQVGAQRAVFTHRIVRLAQIEGETWIETKGDANEDVDPSILPASAVIGEVQATIPYAGYAVRLLSTAQGVLFLFALGVLVLAAAWLLESLELDQQLARARARATQAMTPDPPAGEGATG
jgi:signal peptidase